MKSIFEFSDSIIENNQKSIIFFWHTKPIKEMQAKYTDQSAGTIFGGIPSEDREIYKIKFQENPEALFIIGNLNAMGYGLNLTAARNVIFCELGWTPGEHSQAEKRAHRIGTEHPVNVYYLLARDTIEEKIYNIIAQKRNINRAALGDTVSEEIEEITGDTELTVASELISQFLEKFESESRTPAENIEMEDNRNG
jgi:SWI/SNF-related matrix-associated actin-dependent regulator 1 of chromatin subfamily A